MRHQRHAEHFLGDLGRVVGIFGDFYAAALSAPTRVDLRFHNHAATDFLSSGLRFLNGISDLARAAQGRRTWRGSPSPDTREFS